MWFTLDMGHLQGLPKFPLQVCYYIPGTSPSNGERQWLNTGRCWIYILTVLWSQSGNLSIYHHLSIHQFPLNIRGHRGPLTMQLASRCVDDVKVKMVNPQIWLVKANFVDHFLSLCLGWLLWSIILHLISLHFRSLMIK